MCEAKRTRRRWRRRFAILVVVFIIPFAILFDISTMVCRRVPGLEHRAIPAATLMCSLIIVLGIQQWWVTTTTTTTTTTIAGSLPARLVVHIEIDDSVWSNAAGFMKALHVIMYVIVWSTTRTTSMLLGCLHEYPYIFTVIMTLFFVG